MVESRRAVGNVQVSRDKLTSCSGRMAAAMMEGHGHLVASPSWNFMTDRSRREHGNMPGSHQNRWKDRETIEQTGKLTG